jgi:hypothetical protein
MKLTAIQRQEVKRVIKICRIRGLSLKETLQVVNQQLQPEGHTLSMRAVQDYVAAIKRESRNWLDNMALDVYEFVSELKQRWDELHELKRIEWEMLDKAGMQGRIDEQVKAALAILKTNWQILEMDMLLPQIAIPSNSKVPTPLQQQQQPNQILDDMEEEEDQP